MVWTEIGAIAGVGSIILALWKVTPVREWLGARFQRNRMYNHLSSYDRDILKALNDSETRQISGRYEEEGRPGLYTMLDYIPGAAVNCRLNVTGHYRRSLEHLASHGLLKENAPWDIPSRYNPSHRYVKAYRLTSDGEGLIYKYAVGLHPGEMFIRRWIKGLNRRIYDGQYRDRIAPDAREKLPGYLQGTVWLGCYRPDAKPLGSDQLKRPSIYEYQPGTRTDGVECMVEIPLTNLEIAAGNQVFLAVSTSNTPRYLKFKSGVAESSNAYWIQAIVLSVEESSRPIGTVLKLGQCVPFVPAL